MIYLWMSIIIIVSYFIGNINFARIWSRKVKHNDITQEGSKNPGASNVLRVNGFWLAILTMICEFIKGGVPAIIAGFVIDKYYPGMFQVAFFTAGISVILGQIYPVIYKFKGGKGLAVAAGLFFFNPATYWLSFIFFAVFFLLLWFIDIASVSTLSFITVMISAMTIRMVYWGPASPYWWITIILVWCIWLIELWAHRKNLVRLFKGKENKMNFAENVKKAFKKKKSVKQETPEAEIIIEDEKQNK